MKEKHTCPPVHYQKGSKCLFIFDAESEKLQQAIHEYSRKLNDNGIKTTLLGYINKQLKKDQKAESNTFYRNDLRWFEKPQKEILQQYADGQYDYLISVSKMDHYPINYLAARCKAGIKAGNYSPVNKQILDFMLQADPEDNPAAFLKELDQYLNVIQKK